MEPLDLVGDERRLDVGILGDHETDDLSAAPSRTQHLLVPLGVGTGEHRVGNGENVGRRAVILLELDHLGALELLFEIENVGAVGAAPRVDRLVVVTDHHDVAVLARD